MPFESCNIGGLYGTLTGCAGCESGAVVDTVLVAPVKLIRKIFHEEHFIFRSPTRIDPIHFLNIEMVRIQIFSPRQCEGGRLHAAIIRRSKW